MGFTVPEVSALGVPAVKLLYAKRQIRKNSAGVLEEPLEALFQAGDLAVVE